MQKTFDGENICRNHQQLPIDMCVCVCVCSMELVSISIVANFYNNSSAQTEMCFHEILLHEFETRVFLILHKFMPFCRLNEKFSMNSDVEGKELYAAMNIFYYWKFDSILTDKKMCVFDFGNEEIKFLCNNMNDPKSWILV